MRSRSIIFSISSLWETSRGMNNEEEEEEEKDEGGNFTTDLVSFAAYEVRWSL